jgi:hypothetical protein
VPADGQQSGQPHSRDEHQRSVGNRRRLAPCHRRIALLSVPGSHQRALDRIGRSLAVEDPGLGLRFAFFTVLTRQEAMPETEHVPGRCMRFLCRAALLPLLTVGLAGLVAASWLTRCDQA